MTKIHVLLSYEGGTVKAPVEVPRPTTAFSTAITVANRSSLIVFPVPEEV